jgi:hypothetical protein
MCKCEDETYLRQLIREELAKMRQEHLSQKDSPISKLVALYFDNFPADRVKPSGATLGGQIKLILKQLPYEKLEELIPLLANAGKPISAAWLNWAKDQMQPKQTLQPPTPTAPRFDSSEFDNAQAVPMPEHIRNGLKNALKGVENV